MRHESPTAIAKKMMMVKYSFIMALISTLFCRKFQGYLIVAKQDNVVMVVGKQV